MDLNTRGSEKEQNAIKKIIRQLKAGKDKSPKVMRSSILSCFLGFFFLGVLPVLPASADILPGTPASLDCKDMPKAYQVRFIEFVPGGLKVQLEDGRIQIILNAQCVITEGSAAETKQGVTVIKEELRRN